MPFFVFFYLLLNLLLFMGVFRHLKFFRKEKVIFLYHVFSFCVLAVLGSCLFLFFTWDESLVVNVLWVSLHAIYSLTFLELWSITQIGYSLNILDKVEAGMVSGSREGLRALDEIGTSKKSDRLKTLSAMGLVRSRGGVFFITWLGVVAAFCFKVIIFSVNARNMNE